MRLGRADGRQAGRGGRDQRGGSPIRTLARPLAVAAIAIGGLAACGSPPASNPGPTGTVDVPIQPTLTPISTAEPTVDPSAAGAGGDFDASDQLTTTSCAATGGAWSYSGTMRNPDGAEQTFSVAIFLIRTTDMAPVFTKEIEVTIPAGGSAPVEAQDFHTGAAASLECVTGATVKEQ